MNIVYKSFTKRFNKQFWAFGRQKNLLQVYIGSVGNDDLEMKIYLDDEMVALKKNLKVLWSWKYSQSKNKNC